MEGTLRQFCKTNNVSKLYIAKKLIHSIASYGIKSNDYMAICIRNGSYDIAKYLLLYDLSGNDPIDYILGHFQDDIMSALNYCNFLIDNSAINLPNFYKKLTQCSDNYKHKKDLLKHCVPFISDDIMNFIKL
jgi:hypothetical protein